MSAAAALGVAARPSHLTISKEKKRRLVSSLAVPLWLYLIPNNRVSAYCRYRKTRLQLPWALCSPACQKIFVDRPEDRGRPRGVPQGSPKVDRLHGYAFSGRGVRRCA